MKRRLLWAMALLLTIGFAAWTFSCAEEEDDDRSSGDDDDVSDDDTTDDDTTDDDLAEGNVVEIDDVNDEAIVSMKWVPTADEFDNPFSVGWDGLWVSGMACSMQVWGVYGKTEARVVAVDFYGASPHIEAQKASGGGFEWVTCVDSIEMSAWYHFEVIVDTGAKTYTVNLNGDATSCVDLDYDVSGFTDFTELRYFGYGGTDGKFEIDNVLLSSGKATLFSDDFEDDTAGSQPGEPWEISAVGGATVTVVELPE